MQILRLLKLKPWLLITVIILLLMISVINLFNAYLHLAGPLLQEKVVIIKPRTSTHQVSLQLTENGIISYPTFFTILGKIYALNNNFIKSGEYRFTIGISPQQVFKTLFEGKSIIHKLTIPEGEIVSQIIEKINSDPILVGEIAGNIPEGYLLPSTYFYSYGDQRNNIVDKMRTSMSKALDNIIEKLPPTSLMKTRMEILILASIIEKEAGNDAEKNIIAGVFINRLNKNMKLQADPTSAYAITQGRYKLNRQLTKSDLNVESPYNTYYIKGLPIGPICCPGIKSLEAVVNPAKTKALYFVINGQGGHNFSENLQMHNEHVQNVREILKQRQKLIEDTTK